MNSNKINTLDENGGEEKEQESSFSKFMESDNTKSEPTKKETVKARTLPEEEEEDSGIVFEVTYLKDKVNKQMGIAYTKIPPIFLEEGYMQVNNAFGCLILKEMVLNKKAVERKCRQDLDEVNFRIPSFSGVMVKTMQIQDWMFNDEATTKADFDAAVLETFRELQDVIKEEMKQQAIIEAKRQEEEQRRIQQQQNQNRQQPQRRQERPYIEDDSEEPYYNPNHDPRRRQRAQPRRVQSEELDDLY